MHRFLAVLIVFLMFSGCTVETQTNSRQASQQIDQLYQQFTEAYDSLDVDKVANLYVEDAYYLVPTSQRAILEGRPSIRKSFAGFMKGAAKQNRNIEISFRILERKISDSLAFDVGYYRVRSKADTVTVFPEGGSVGKFVTVIGLMPDGSWKFLLDGYNPAPVEAFSEAESVHNPTVAK